MSNQIPAPQEPIGSPIEQVTVLEKQQQKYPASNMPYIIAVTIMSVLTILAVVAITLLRPTSDNTTLIGTVVGITMPTTMALLAFMKSQETHLAVNSRLEDFMNAAKQLANQQGMIAGKIEERKVQADRREAAISARIADNKIEGELREARHTTEDDESDPSTIEKARRINIEQRMANVESKQTNSKPSTDSMAAKVDEASIQAEETVDKINVVKDAVADLDKTLDKSDKPRS